MTKPETLGMQRWQRAPTCFFDESSRARALVLGDDFAVASPKDGVVRVRLKLKQRYGVKVRAISGRNADDNKDIVVLGRAVRWRHNWVGLEAGQKHGRHIRDELGIVSGSSGVVFPVVPAGVAEEVNEKKLSREESSKYRVLAARGNYLGMGRPDTGHEARRRARRTPRRSRGSPGASRPCRRSP